MQGRRFEGMVRSDFVPSLLLPIVLGEEIWTSRLVVAPNLDEPVEPVAGLLPSRISFSIRCSSAAWA